MAAPTLPPALWTTREVAAYLCLPRRRIAHMARDGLLPCVQLPGGEMMFDPQELAEWLARCRRPSREGGMLNAT